MNTNKARRIRLRYLNFVIPPNGESEARLTGHTEAGGCYEIVFPTFSEGNALCVIRSCGKFLSDHIAVQKREHNSIRECIARAWAATDAVIKGETPKVSP